MLYKACGKLLLRKVVPQKRSGDRDIERDVNEKEGQLEETQP